MLYSIWYHHTCRWPSGALVERGLCTGRTPTGVMIPDSVSYNFDLLMMSTCLKRMKIIGWRAKVGDRQEWNRIVEQTKTHTGL